MVYYVSNATGKKMIGGKNFKTQNEAEAAAQRAVRIAAGRATHGWSPFDVVEAVPGRHMTRAVVYPDKIERQGCAR